ncbi:hypothetical protein [Aliterella atlantica]|uniref:Uncharacterized protein n=1 Tax=Aliterella atlantica CENA595 TaxID=1618023 RepID=A0A0D8ZYC8_9CYAN|nr:hypothetical protein [Aliterella atlantica]KJH73412.1 hypothetical protein UH38_01145 [Aliterella atlantica CENA595]
MADSRRQTLPSDGLNLGLFTIPNQILLQISTVPVLAALVAGKAVAETMQAIGQSSEEVFRGDRLPILPFPTQE